MSRIATMIAALADTALAVVVGILTPLAVAVAGWLISGSFQTTEWEVPLTAAMALWTLGLTSAVGFTVQPTSYPSLQLAESFDFVVSIAPLGLTALVVWFAWRTGRRIAHADDDGPWLSLAVSTTAFIIFNQLALQIGATDLARLEPGGVAAGGTLIWLVGLLAGVRIWEFVPWARLLGDRADRILHTASDAARLALGFIVGLFALASALVLVGLIVAMGEIVGLTQLLQLDAWGNIAVGLTELIYLPTLLVWAVSWLLGAGVQLGAGTMANPGATDAGPLPIVPLLGVVPEPQGALMWSLLALPVLLAAVLTLWLRTTTPRADDDGAWWQRMLVPASASIAAAAGLCWLAYLSRGAIGPGRLAEFGPVPWLVLVCAAGLLLVGATVGTFIPVRTVVAESSERDESWGDPYGEYRTDDLDEVRRQPALRAVDDDGDNIYAEFDELDGPAPYPWWRRVGDSVLDRTDALVAGRRGSRRRAAELDEAEGDAKADARRGKRKAAAVSADEQATDDLSELRESDTAAGERGSEPTRNKLADAEPNGTHVTGTDATAAGEFADQADAAGYDFDAAEEEDEDEDAPLTVVRRPALKRRDEAAGDETNAAAPTEADEPRDTAAENDEAPASEPSGRRRPLRSKKAAPRRDLGDLADALRRPDEPDIYGDIDLDEEPGGRRK